MKAYSLLLLTSLALFACSSQDDPASLKRNWAFDHVEASATESDSADLSFFNKDFIGLEWQFSDSLRISKQNGEKRAYSYILSPDGKKIDLGLLQSEKRTVLIIELSNEKLAIDVGTLPILVFTPKQ